MREDSGVVPHPEQPPLSTPKSAVGRHTPGPWRATKFSSVVGCPITAQPDKSQNTVVIAGVHGAFGDDYRAEVEANALLIAAAPELLRCLRNMLSALGAALDDGLRELLIKKIEVTARAAEAAILKATGGEA